MKAFPNISNYLCFAQFDTSSDSQKNVTNLSFMITTQNITPLLLCWQRTRGEIGLQILFHPSGSSIVTLVSAVNRICFQVYFFQTVRFSLWVWFKGGLEMSFMILVISSTILHLVFLYIGSMLAFAKMEMLVPFGSILTLHAYFFAYHTCSCVFIFHWCGVGFLFYILSSLAKFRKVSPLAITVTILCFSVVVNRHFWVI